ncbi:periplasmic sugar binding protein-like protein [Rubrobacter xylanophilus DSM 9941]|uniref:Periplasmic sugar binding protein-like protein n=1 Tax=Rubrobacter xylanophilus (strain DSM 9941 / JCM 11954 / NBRC 16129 / PRD-1) TaxID=266117 RepID=Q1AZ05_RUBXD|nr:ABC transporter substrate-binding protein [Rubrobacter xylanophilus]ABG03373.1 periplasmic sugar binding protein-like protein [Rubrobacter xylanophilus DSM 9941]
MTGSSFARWGHRGAALLAAVAAVLLVAACGGGGSQQGSEGGAPYTIGVSNGFISSEWRTQMIQDLERVNKEYMEEGLTEELVIESADVDVQGQIQQMRNLINQGVDAIIVNPNSVTGLNQVIKEASDAGIVVISVDQEIPAEGAINVVIDQAEWARRSAEWLVEQLGGEGDVVVINGIAGHPANEARYDAVKEVFSRNPGIEVIAEANANWDQATGQQKMSNILASETGIDGVWTQDGMARGVLQAIVASDPERFPVVVGEARLGYMRLWHELRQQDEDFSSYGVINPPGVGASGLRVAVEMLRGKELKEGVLSGEANNTIYVPIPGVVNDQNFDEWYARVKDKEGEYVLDGIISREKAQSYFKQ